MDETKQFFLFSERNQPFTRLRTTYHWLRTPDEDDFNSFFGMFWRMYLYFRNSEPPSHTFTASNLLPFFSLSKLKKEGLKIMKPSLCFLCSVSMPPQDQTCCLICGRCFHVNCASSHNCNQPLTSSTNPSSTNLLTNDPRMYVFQNPVSSTGETSTVVAASSSLPEKPLLQKSNWIPINNAIKKTSLERVTLTEADDVYPPWNPLCACESCAQAGKWHLVQRNRTSSVDESDCQSSKLNSPPCFLDETLPGYKMACEFARKYNLPAPIFRSKQTKEGPGSSISSNETPPIESDPKSPPALTESRRIDSGVCSLCMQPSTAEHIVWLHLVVENRIGKIELCPNRTVDFLRNLLLKTVAHRSCHIIILAAHGLEVLTEGDMRKISEVPIVTGGSIMITFLEDPTVVEPVEQTS
ncbi:hypothetical protein BCR33DRAFT_718327 [Rhizoclosmatium globosum]|uniref:Uncharacterized protein n=1 Tax=Rhizoclosmatium globosum TaxID=329046 RepID=A0A1Y2C8J6_9FUNG|nr:hypothetical protein BCR33DRAFT_718327 [Rhizoclosmatium globosum]|eukprot:ORY42635.1 hypothetical protein BCR33DRAFT_718327 [Rhizoclosmatium globosum]